jgi:hypothetical protein
MFSLRRYSIGQAWKGFHEIDIDQIYMSLLILPIQHTNLIMQYLKLHGPPWASFHKSHKTNLVYLYILEYHYASI